jgi:hypothetical protein
VQASERFVVRSVSRTAAVGGLALLAIAVIVAVVLAVVSSPVLLAIVPVEILIAVRFAQLGTYVSGNALVLRGVFATKRLSFEEIEHITIDAVQPAGARAPYRAGIAVLRDGRRVELPGVSESCLDPAEPQATLRRIQDATGLATRDAAPVP